jgi:hypothetical protein
MNGKLLLFGRDQIESNFKRLIDCEIHKLRRDERRLAEQRITKHRLKARNSCVVDARSYRVAKQLPPLLIA